MLFAFFQKKCPSYEACSGKLRAIYVLLYLTIKLFFIGLLKHINWMFSLNKFITLTVSGIGCLSRKCAVTSTHFIVSRLWCFSLTILCCHRPSVQPRIKQERNGCMFQGHLPRQGFVLEDRIVSKTSIPRSWFRDGQDTSKNTHPHVLSLTEPDQTRSKHLLSPQRKDNMAF